MPAPSGAWARAYRLALRTLPAGLRRKHGAAMEALFARELDRARARGPVHGALAGAAGVWDVVRRAAHERLRPAPAMRAALARHAAAFGAAFGALTAALVAVYAARRATALGATGGVAAVAEAALLAVPFTAALTVPMAVLVAVLWESTRPVAAPSTGAAAPARLAPVLGAAAGVAVAALVLTAEVVPRANARLAAVHAAGAPAAGAPAPGPNERAMTLGELRAAARGAAPAAAAAYAVEVHKKFALPAACVVLAVAGAAAARRAPRPRGAAGRAALVVGVSLPVFAAYYALLVTGEQLADRLIVPPAVGMWAGNAVVLAGALLLLLAGRRPAAAPAAAPPADG